MSFNVCTATIIDFKCLYLQDLYLQDLYIYEKVDIIKYWKLVIICNIGNSMFGGQL